MLVSLRVDIALPVHIQRLFQLHFILIHQLILVKESYELALSRLEHDLTRELVHSQSLNNVKDVDLQIELLFGIFLHPIFAFGAHAEAHAA